MIQAKEAVLTWDWGNFVADCGREMARVFAVSQELKPTRIVAAKGGKCAAGYVWYGGISSKGHGTKPRLQLNGQREHKRF
jgi:hypothetical protein